MKLTKRMASLFLALTLSMGLAIPAFAAEDVTVTQTIWLDEPQPAYVDTPPATPANAFTDVAATSPYAAAVSWAVDMKITAGTSATTFAPGAACTNAQIITFLWRAKGQPEPRNTSNNPYANVNESNYYYKAALWAHDNEIVSDKAFDFSTLCTRRQAVTYLHSILEGGASSDEGAAFTDVASDAEYAQAVAWAVKNGITTGTSATTFSPDASCTRGQIVTFMYRAMK